MWFYITNPGHFRAKFYFHPKDAYFGFRAENLKTAKFPRITWNVSAFLNQMDCQRLICGLVRMIGKIRKKRLKKTYKIKKEQNIVQIAAPIVIRCVRKRLQAMQNEKSA